MFKIHSAKGQKISEQNEVTTFSLVNWFLRYPQLFKVEITKHNFYTLANQNDKTVDILSLLRNSEQLLKLSWKVYVKFISIICKLTSPVSLHHIMSVMSWSFWLAGTKLAWFLHGSSHIRSVEISIKPFVKLWMYTYFFFS